MTQDLLALVVSDILIGLLVASLGIFAWSTIKSKSVRSFQFQLSAFILIWVSGEIVDVLLSSGSINIDGIDEIPMQIHLVAMILFCLMLWLRFYYSKIKGTKMVEKPADFFTE